MFAMDERMGLESDGGGIVFVRIYFALRLKTWPAFWVQGVMVRSQSPKCIKTNVMCIEAVQDFWLIGYGKPAAHGGEGGW